ncbi:MAG: hypothetical protein PHP30_05090 [Bacteroidales bacterium]|nr:hypothetical protein [Bacteroidales bacterium]MDD2425122.1 hypothetical protein [Bacteroidales bacterium]MDD3989457.1 hypothetical protein [Bacteroidales bacterium]MDD4639101.1 hypothetical protein [Bacteroidales bacterium]
MTERSYLEQIPAAAISDTCRDAVSVIINNSGDNSIIGNLESLCPQRSYKVYYTEPGIGQLNEVLEMCSQSRIPALTICGKDCNEILDSNIPAGSFVTLISPGSGWEDNTLERLLDKGNICEFSHIAWQNYFYNPDLLDRTRAKSFEELRLGLIRKDLTLTEPPIRSSHYIFLDLNSVRVCDYPGNIRKTPNGLYADEICQVARYIGMGQNLKAVFIYGFPSESKPDSVSTELAAEILWHISEALSSNISEDPSLPGNEDSFLKKIVSMGKEGQDIVFINSSLTGRWWMQIPEVKTSDNLFIACSYTDYLTACNGEIPLRWLFFFQKFNNK